MVNKNAWELKRRSDLILCFNCTNTNVVGWKCHDKNRSTELAIIMYCYIINSNPVGCGWFSTNTAGITAHTLFLMKSANICQAVWSVFCLSVWHVFRVSAWESMTADRAADSWLWMGSASCSTENCLFWVSCHVSVRLINNTEILYWQFALTSGMSVIFWGNNKLMLKIW